MHEIEMPNDQLVLTANAKIEALCNTPDDAIRANIRANALRNLPWVRMEMEHSGHAVICGGGPSLADTLDEIKRRAADGQTIFALNGVGDWLIEHGLTPDYLVIIDARPRNVQFVERRCAKKYLIASQCAPELFDALEGADVRLFHCAMDNLPELLPRTGHEEVMITGQHTSGLLAMSLVGALGYRMLHLYGYDSSDRDGAAHAYRQEQTEAEQKRLNVKFNGRWYSSSFAMLKQAEDFSGMAQSLADAGCTITVHGSGLLPAMAHDMVRHTDQSIAVYDFNAAPSSWDFTTWLIKAEMFRRVADAGGPLQVKFIFTDTGLFDNRNLCVSEDYRAQIFKNVIRPSLALVGAVETDDPGAAEVGTRYGNYVSLETVRAAREGHPVPRFVPLKEDLWTIDGWLKEYTGGQEPFVITLRESTHWPERNSDVGEWIKFADYLRDFGPVVFVRDSEKAEEPITGHLTCPIASYGARVRCALYHRAKCNFMVANGPSNLAIYGERPYLIFKNLVDQKVVTYRPGTAQWWEMVMGVPVGSQFPWALPTQGLIWEPDDNYPVLRKAFQWLAPMIGIGA